MKKVVGLILLMGIGFGAVATEAKFVGKLMVKKVSADSEKGIAFFEGTWTEALEEAKKQDKLIFLDAYATWCGPCKMMAKKTFTEPEVGTFFNENFINFKMDMENNPDGPRLSRKFKLRAYPTLYFVKGDESIAHEELGYQKPNQLIAIGKKALEL